MTLISSSLLSWRLFSCFLTIQLYSLPSQSSPSSGLLRFDSPSQPNMSISVTTYPHYVSLALSIILIIPPLNSQISSLIILLTTYPTSPRHTSFPYSNVVGDLDARSLQRPGHRAQPFHEVEQVVNLCFGRARLYHQLHVYILDLVGRFLLEPAGDVVLRRHLDPVDGMQVDLQLLGLEECGVGFAGDQGHQKGFQRE